MSIKQGDFLLKNISFSLEETENLVITGASGSGKTLLARALCGKIFHTGNILFFTSGKEKTSVKSLFVEQRYTIRNRSNTVDGYYQQRYNSHDNEDSYTVFEELKFISEEEDKINFLLSELDVFYLKDKPLLQLSSGEHKRFQLIKALLQPTELLVLDEPFTGLDNSCREKLNEILGNLSINGTKLIIISGSHHPLPDCITHVLALENDTQKAFTKKENYIFATPQNIYHFDSDLLPLNGNNRDFIHAVFMKNVTVKYGDRIILDKINWQLKRGERWLLRGKNGSGKSTLMSLITGDNPQAYANEIYLFDKRRGSGETIWDIKKRVGFISPELYAFFDKSISCFDTVASGYFDTMGLYKRLTREQTQHINQWFKALNVSGLAQKRLTDVSSGMQRLFILIRAFIKNPPLLIFDEPCQGLDEVQTKAFIKLVDDICEKTETTVIYISHYENEVPKCVEKVLQLENGRAAQLAIKRVSFVSSVKYNKPPYIETIHS